MGKESFLKRLEKENKLKLVESNEAIKESYLEKSDSNLASAKILLENDKLEESVGLAYYSMYNMTTALLFKVGIKCENHSGTIILLKELFELDNSQIDFAKKERIDKQYYADFHLVREDVVEMIEIAEEFNGKILDFVSKISEQKIKEYRIKFKEILK